MKIKLFPKQAKALFSDVDELLYGGAAGGGKSYLLRVAAMYYALKYPNLQIFLVRRSYPELEQNHLYGKTGFPALLKEYINSGLVDSKNGGMSFHFRNGSIIKLAHCSSIDDALKYQGPEISMLLIDEVSQIKSEVYEFLHSRVRLIGMKIPGLPRTICAGNPGGIGHTWVKNKWVIHGTEPWLNTETDSTHLFIPAGYSDNPVLMHDDPGYINRLNGFSDPAKIKAFRDGNWDIVAGGAIDDVWRTNVHVIQPFRMSRNTPIYRTFDWGSSKPFSVGWWAVMNGEQCQNGKVYPPKTVIRVAELYGCGQKPNTGLYLDETELGKRIKEKDCYVRDFIGGVTYPGPADTQIFDYRSNGSIADLINRGFGGTCFTRANKGAGSRVAGLQMLRQRLTNSVKNENEGLYVFTTCEDFIRTVPVLPRDKINADDVDSNAEDHIYDETRYMILANNMRDGIIEVEVG